MEVLILGSGSGGNATLVNINGFKFLVDAGFSGKKIKEKLADVKVSIEDIEAILVTHEHGDHIQGVGILARKHNIPVYITPESHEAGFKKLGHIPEELLNIFDGKFKLADHIMIRPFDVKHDAKRTVGYRVTSDEGKSLVLATDIGYVDNLVREYFKGANIIIIECNYDYHKLMECSYPWELKHRVKSRNGHLSNEDAAKLVVDVYHPELKKVFLTHVSKDSNCYNIALATMEKTLEASGVNVDLEVAKQDNATSLCKI